jgi:hypothetical protein
MMSGIQASRAKDMSGRSQISVCMFFLEKNMDIGECGEKFSLSDVDWTRSISGGLNGWNDKGYGWILGSGKSPDVEKNSP